LTALVLALFVAVYVGMALGRWPGLAIDRTGIALVGAILLHLAGVMDAAAIEAAIDAPTLVVLFGLMVLSAQFAACGFYGWCSRRLAAARLRPAALLVLTGLVAASLSAVLANDVVVFAMIPPLCLGLARRGLDPRPFVIAVAGAANAGSAATLIGNPQNILIGQLGGLDFWRFLLVCGPPALLGTLIVLLTVLLVWRGRLSAGAADLEAAAFRGEPPLDRPGLVKALIATAVLLTLFATPLPHTAGVLAIAGALLVSRKLASRRILALVDWHLLILFAGLFVVTGALHTTGLPAGLVAGLAAYGLALDALPVLAPLTVLGSNTIGNVPLVMLLLAVLPDATPVTLHALAVISTLAGNLLLVGSLANIIAVERAREVGVAVGFALHARCGVPMTVLGLAAALGWLLIVERLGL
jgi:Na+/H+ antiporter NhaD/arsenite permease-like protein